FTLPERVADDYAAGPATPYVIGGSKDASPNRGDAENIEKNAAHPHASGGAGLPPPGGTERVITPGDGAPTSPPMSGSVLHLWGGDRGVRARKSARAAGGLRDFHFG